MSAYSPSLSLLVLFRLDCRWPLNNESSDEEEEASAPFDSLGLDVYQFEARTTDERRHCHYSKQSRDFSVLAAVTAPSRQQMRSNTPPPRKRGKTIKALRYYRICSSVARAAFVTRLRKITLLIITQYPELFCSRLVHACWLSANQWKPFGRAQRYLLHLSVRTTGETTFFFASSSRHVRYFTFCFRLLQGHGGRGDWSGRFDCARNKYWRSRSTHHQSI